MESASFRNILLVGSGKLTASVATNLLQSAATVYFLSNDAEQDKQFINENIADCKHYGDQIIDKGRLQYVNSADDAKAINLAIIITEEQLASKQQQIREIEQALPAESIIAINTESFLLEDLQKNTTHPERIIGLNWCHPAHTTAFLEIVANKLTPALVVKDFDAIARTCWQKDPYVVSAGYSVRARMMAALAREAFYLVGNGYASIEDIDRACRNDAGYYLPFAGNCRYMDLMGTYAYGLVMKDLNRELSKHDQPPSFFENMIEAGKNGMENNAGFYNYAPGEQQDWEEKFRKFSFEIKEIIDKYPFGYLKEQHKKVSSKITLDE